MRKQNKYLMILIILLIQLLTFCCQEKPPDVKVNNLSRSYLDIHFRIAECSCPSVTLLDVPPSSETSYREVTTNNYLIKLYSLNNEVGTDFYLKPEMNKQYQLIIDTSYNCKVNTFDK